MSDNMRMVMDDYRKMMATCESAGFSTLGKETCAKLLAIVYTYNSEVFTMSPKLREDLAYIQRKYKLQGGEIPDVGMSKLFQRYARILDGTDAPDGKVPEWVNKFLKERYNIKM